MLLVISGSYHNVTFPSDISENRSALAKGTVAQHSLGLARWFQVNNLLPCQH